MSGLVAPVYFNTLIVSTLTGDRALVTAPKLLLAWIDNIYAEGDVRFSVDTKVDVSPGVYDLGDASQVAPAVGTRPLVTRCVGVFNTGMALRHPRMVWRVVTMSHIADVAIFGFVQMIPSSPIWHHLRQPFLFWFSWSIANDDSAYELAIFVFDLRPRLLPIMPKVCLAV